MKISQMNVDFSKDFLLMAGPCSIESFEQLSHVAKWVKEKGACILRGGIFKLRTSHKSFQGKGHEAFDWVKTIKKQTGLPFISEITDPRQIESFLEFVDIFQVGTRNMYNYEMLKELGSIDKPVLLKRSFCSRVEEWIDAAEYVVQHGNENVILCERGIRTFETTTRNTLDLNSVAFIKQNFSFPVIVDPSHGTGKRCLVKPMSLAALACGSDGLILEVHPEPKKALSDGEQSLDFKEFQDIVTDLKHLLPSFQKQLKSPSLRQDSLSL